MLCRGSLVQAFWKNGSGHSSVSMPTTPLFRRRLPGSEMTLLDPHIQMRAAARYCEGSAVPHVPQWCASKKNCTVLQFTTYRGSSVGCRKSRIACTVIRDFRAPTDSSARRVTLGCCSAESMRPNDVGLALAVSDSSFPSLRGDSRAQDSAAGARLSYCPILCASYFRALNSPTAKCPGCGVED